MSEDVLPKTIVDFDWSATPLGPRESWSAALRTTYDIMMTAHFAMCAMWGPERTLIYNEAYIPFLADRHPAALGQPIDEVWHDVWDNIRPLIEQAMAGERVHMVDMPLVMTRKGYTENTFWTFSYSPLNEGDKAMGFLNIAFETTARVEATKAQALIDKQLRESVDQRTLLAHELDHRVKNILSMVTAISHQTFRPPATMESASKEFAARIRALAKAQDILTQTSWTGAKVSEVAFATLAEGIGARVKASGPDVELSAKSALALALALHELATNAVKYGALSADSGNVDLTWQVEVEENKQSFLLRWIETGGPLVRPPERRGFGTRLITSALSSEFRGSAEIEYPSQGVVFTLKAPHPFSESV